MKKALNSVRNQGSSKKVLITGIAGFAGSHLAEYLLAKKFTIFGFFHPDHSIKNLAHIEHKLNLSPCNILKKKEVRDHVLDIKPDYVFHLAAVSSAAESFKTPKKTLANNIFPQIYLLNAVKETNPKAKILVIGSSEEYGNIDAKHLPVDENAPIAPVSPYAVSKVAQDMLGLQYFLQSKLKIVRVRPFNHIGPRQAPHFVVPAFAEQIAALEKNNGGTIEVGNLDVWRDFTDVRDMVRAYFLAAEIGKPGEVYNLGSQKAYKIADILKKLILFSKVKIKIRVNKNLFRPIEIKKVYCNFEKFRKQTGWIPEIPIEKTLSDTIEFERKSARN